MEHPIWSGTLLLLLLTLVHGFNPSLWIVRWLSGTMIPYDYTALMKVLQGHLYWWPTWNDGAGYGWHISRTFSGKSKTRNDIQVAFIKFDIGITPAWTICWTRNCPFASSWIKVQEVFGVPHKNFSQFCWGKWAFCHFGVFIYVNVSDHS